MQGQRASHGYVPGHSSERSIRWGEVRKFVELVKRHGFAELCTFLQEYGSLFRRLLLFDINEEPPDKDLLAINCASLVRLISRVDEITFSGHIHRGCATLVTDRTKKVTFATKEVIAETQLLQACVRHRCWVSLASPMLDEAGAASLGATGLIDFVDFSNGVPAGRYDLIAALRCRSIDVFLPDEANERLFIGSVLLANAASFLQELHLVGSSIGCVSNLVASLARLSQLSVLHMRECQVSLTDLRGLEMPRLSKLRFVAAPDVDCRDLKALSMLTNLEHLSWDSEKCSSAEFLGEAVTSFLPRLQSLSWSPFRLDLKFASSLIGHRHLTKLNLMGRSSKGAKETIMALQTLCKGTKIRFLKLHLSVDNIEGFKHWLTSQPDVALEKLRLGSYYVLDVYHRKKRRSDYLTAIMIIEAAYQRSLAGALQVLPPELVEHVLVHAFPAEFLNRKTTDLEKAYRLISTHVARTVRAGSLQIKPVRLIERRQDPWDVQVKQ